MLHHLPSWWHEDWSYMWDKALMTGSQGVDDFEEWDSEYEEVLRIS